MKMDNKLPEEPTSSPLDRFISQLLNPLTYVLFAACLLSFLLREYGDVLVILTVVIFNGLMGMIQEGKAAQALAALNRMAAPTACIRKDDKLLQVPAASLQPGDIVILEAGAQVPADLRLTKVSVLSAEESALTGESLPIHKSAGDLAYMSTMITSGHGEGIVIAIGTDTEIGRIASMIARKHPVPTPLQVRLGKLGKMLSLLAVLICVVLFLAALLSGGDPAEMLITSVSLAVAAVPEGLPSVVTIVLAIGVGRLAAAGTIIRKLPAAETLGCVDVVCSDKTGTLTQNRMTVVSLYYNERTQNADASGVPEELIRGFCLCNNASVTEEKESGDPTETALLRWGVSLGADPVSLNRAFPRTSEEPFSPESRQMSTTHRTASGAVTYRKGAADVLIVRCRRILLYGKEKELTVARKKHLLQEIRELSSRGLRLLALSRDDLFLGIAAMKDPIRPESLPAIRTFRQAGVRTVMITGDHPQTAAAIARELTLLPEGSDSTGILTGDELDHISDPHLEELLPGIRVFARVSPVHKVRIVQAYRRTGHITAMTGDGVNDAPSLREADIGIAMGAGGTDVARQAADLILTDDNFATITKAIEEGRSIYENIRKTVLFLLSSNFGEIITMFFCVLCRLEIPLSAIHILWINLITDSLPALALGMDKNDRTSLMRRPPRSGTESLMAGGGWFCTVFYGFFIAAISLFAFLTIPYLFLKQSNLPFSFSLIREVLAIPAILIRAQTYAFTTLGISQLFHAVGMRDQSRSIFAMNHLENPVMIASFFLGFLLQLAVTEFSPLTRLFGTVSLAPAEWGYQASLSATPLFIHQIFCTFTKR